MNKSKLVSPFITFALGVATALALSAPGVVRLMSSTQEPVIEEPVASEPCPEETPAPEETPVATDETTETADGEDGGDVVAGEGDECAEPEEDSVDDGESAEEQDDSEEQDDGDDAEGDHPDNHGAAVSTAAHCPIRGRAHGELVRSIAHDKDATVADAKAACDAALAEQEEAEASETADGEDDGHGKPPWAGGGPPPWAGQGGSKEHKNK